MGGDPGLTRPPPLELPDVPDRTLDDVNCPSSRELRRKGRGTCLVLGTARFTLEDSESTCTVAARAFWFCGTDGDWRV